MIIRGELILRNYYISSPTWEDKLEFYSMVDHNDMFTSFLRKITTNSSVIIIKKTAGDMVLSSLTPGKRLFLLCTHNDMPSVNSIIFDPETYSKYNETIIVLTCKHVQELDYFKYKLKQLTKDQRINVYTRNKLRFYLSVTQESYPYSNELSWLIKSGMLIADLRTYALNKMDRFIVCCQQQTIDNVILLKSIGYIEGNTKDPGDFIYNRSFIDPDFKSSIDLDVLPWQSKAKHPNQQSQSCILKEDKNKIKTFNVYTRGIWVWELN
ncbi:Ferredoxin--NADP reductase [Candidatus Hodgkinia cicadicola]|uniref:Ferredoxin--NADP reductase n=1 Tax=Candidatus Hodgkinia cicadicola TaxID=573658 RepID=A0ABX4MFI2_9HYPH|nr:Ferredoxin--NADP reductase [Candidatus Hodgkinia cicadicola]